jgi:tripartite-type tricarboxylate transporter receptor subunit TctC
MLTRRSVLAVLASPFLMSSAGAQGAWPNRPIRFIVPSAAGGAPDIVCRILGNELSQRLGQQVVVDNRAGAGGNIGMEALVTATPADGHVIGYGGVNTMSINRALFQRLPFNPETDIEPVAMFLTTPNMLVVSPTLVVRNVTDLIALARARPGQLTMASPGVGTTSHLSGELFRAMARLDVVHVPYRGSPPALQDIAGGRIDFMFDNLASAATLARPGTVRGIAVSTARRSPLFPELPTVAESGLAGYETSAWGGVVVPKGTPAAVIQRLETEVSQIAGTERFKTAMSNAGAEVAYMSRADWQPFIAAESQKWTEVVRVSGARAE